MNHSLRLLLLVAALFAGALFAACGGDGDDGGDGNGNGPVATEVQNGDDGDGNGDDDGDGDGDGGNGIDVSDELRALAEEFGITEVKIEYNFSSIGVEGAMTLYSKPPDAWRMDISSEGGDVIIISTPDASYSCASFGGEGVCSELPADGEIPVPFLDIFADPGELTSLIDVSVTGVDIDESSRSIAGQDATCFSTSGTIDGESSAAEYCFRDDGVLLLLSTGGTGFEFSLEATSVENSVSDDDLEPPYDIVDIGDIGDIPGLD